MKNEYNYRILLLSNSKNELDLKKISGDSIFESIFLNKIKHQSLNIKKHVGFVSKSFLFSLPEELINLDLFRKKCVEWSQKTKTIDLILQKEEQYTVEKKLFVFDMDSTLIKIEVIDELAKLAGAEEKVVSVTEEAMQGKIDFDESLTRRVSYLKALKWLKTYQKNCP